ncbi:MAG: thiamine ABC transporter substrate binding subunit [Gemmobacter sp.]
MRYPVIAAGFCALAALSGGVAVAETPVLTVLTYDSFVADWGPGPQVKAAFEAECGCELRLLGAGDGAALLARLRLEGGRGEADVVLGLDTNLTAAAADTGLFAPHGLRADFDLPVAWDDPLFLPYDWSWFAFVHDTARLPDPPSSLAALAASDIPVVIQDPRSSTPGLGLLMWVEAVHGEGAVAVWEDLADNIVTVTPGWSEAYGLFLNGEAGMVLSYTTSPAYHIIAEGDDTKAAAIFDEGHYMQVEVAGMLAASRQPELAARFLEFMLSDAFQSVIPETNWMYPAVTPEGGLPEGFAALPVPQVSHLFGAEEAQARRDPALEVWLRVLSR